MTLLSYHSSNLPLIALETMRLLVQIFVKKKMMRVPTEIRQMDMLTLVALLLALLC